MQRIDKAPEVLSMALALKLDPSRGVVNEFLRHCNEKIAGFAKKAKSVATLDELQAVVAKGLSLVFEEVWSDEDLAAISKKYVAMGEFAFASLSMQLEGDTFATLMEREHVVAGAHDRYVAVIDCRGEKGARRYFTRWHEIAHLLTHVRQLDLPFQRVNRAQSTKHDPIERLMDKIAGEVGFYEPLFAPAVELELTEQRYLTFDGVQRVRERFCPIASFQASLIACVNRSSVPTVLLEAEMAYKKAEAAEVRSGQATLFASTKPVPKLRAVSAMQNAAARTAGFSIHPNMAIPAGSIVAKYHAAVGAGEILANGVGEEDLSIWRHSNGEAVGFGPIRIEARQIGGCTYALVQKLVRTSRPGR